jgi:hypothetical protein
MTCADFGEIKCYLVGLILSPSVFSSQLSEPDFIYFESQTRLNSPYAQITIDF